MATDTLAELASRLLVAARRCDSADDVFGEVSAIFERWHIHVPEDLWRETRLAGPLTLGERSGLTTRWLTLFAGLLTAHPDAEPQLRVLVEKLKVATGVSVCAPPAEIGSQFAPDMAVPSEEAPPELGFAQEAEPADAPEQSAPEPAAPAAPAGVAYPTTPPAPPAPEAAWQSRGPGDPDPVSEAIQAAVRPGLLAFNPPDEMTQGRAERVEVGIARSAELMDAVVAGLRGRGPVRIEQLPTSAFMSAELRGESFVIRELSPAEQIVAPSARWEFDVTPRHAGVQKLTLCVSMRFAETGPLAVPGSRIAVPVVERQVRIRVSVGYGTRVFVGQNWQWLVGTAVAVAGALAAVLAVIH